MEFEDGGVGMKKKHFIVIIVAVVLILIILCIKSFLGEKPFKKLSVDEISNVSVTLTPPGVTLELSSNEIEELVKILHTVVIYKEDNSYTEYSGQGVIFMITKTDGTQIDIMAYNPFLVIDNTGYKTKYEPCEELNSLGNQIRRSNE